MEPDLAIWEKLLEQARAAAGRAHAPYSGHAVGAALLGEGDRIFLGANVENASYPVGLCAERGALAAAVAAGERRFLALALSLPGPGLSTPCGACRQFLAELCRDLPILIEARAGGRRRRHLLSALLPEPFRLDGPEEPPPKGEVP